MASKKQTVSTWAEAVLSLKEQDSTPPPGFQSIDEIAAELKNTEEHTRRLVNRLVKAGRAEVYNGKQLSTTGAMINCKYFRLVGA